MERMSARENSGKGVQKARGHLNFLGGYMCYFKLGPLLSFFGLLLRLFVLLKILQSGKGPKTIMKQDSKKSRICQLKQTDGTLTSDRSQILFTLFSKYKFMGRNGNTKQTNLGRVW